jgi:hypothetical protein
MGVANGMHGRESHMYKIWDGKPAKKKQLEELDLEEHIIQYYVNIILKICFNKRVEKALIGLMWLQIQKNGGLSSTLKKTSGSVTCYVLSCLAQDPLSSKYETCCTELVVIYA